MNPLTARGAGSRPAHPAVTLGLFALRSTSSCLLCCPTLACPLLTQKLYFIFSALKLLTPVRDGVSCTCVGAVSASSPPSVPVVSRHHGSLSCGVRNIWLPFYLPLSSQECYLYHSHNDSYVLFTKAFLCMFGYCVPVTTTTTMNAINFSKT